MGLTTADLEGMRDTVEDSLPDTAVIQTQAWNSDGGGGGTTVWTASGTVPCRISPLTPKENAEPTTGGRITPDSDWVITLPALTALDEKARLSIGGTAFEVVHLDAPRSWELSRRVEVSKAN